MNSLLLSTYHLQKHFTWVGFDVSMYFPGTFAEGNNDILDYSYKVCNPSIFSHVTSSYRGFIVAISVIVGAYKQFNVNTISMLAEPACFFRGYLKLEWGYDHPFRMSVKSWTVSQISMVDILGIFQGSRFGQFVQ